MLALDSEGRTRDFGLEDPHVAFTPCPRRTVASTICELSDGSPQKAATD
jgi:hypothetical protein